jgi:hypothetical protein
MRVPSGEARATQPSGAESSGGEVCVSDEGERRSRQSVRTAEEKREAAAAGPCCRRQAHGLLARSGHSVPPHQPEHPGAGSVTVAIREAQSEPGNGKQQDPKQDQCRHLIPGHPGPERQHGHQREARDVARRPEGSTPSWVSGVRHRFLGARRTARRRGATGGPFRGGIARERGARPQILLVLQV